MQYIQASFGWEHPNTDPTIFYCEFLRHQTDSDLKTLYYRLDAVVLWFLNTVEKKMYVYILITIYTITSYFKFKYKIISAKLKLHVFITYIINALSILNKILFNSGFTTMVLLIYNLEWNCAQNDYIYWKMKNETLY